MAGVSRALRPVDEAAVAHSELGCDNHADSLARTAPPCTSYRTSSRSHTAAAVVGHGMLIQGPEGLVHATLGPVTAAAG